MAPSRKTPSLFEVMRQTDPRRSAPPPPGDRPPTPPRRGPVAVPARPAPAPAQPPVRLVRPDDEAADPVAPEPAGGVLAGLRGRVNIPGTWLLLGTAVVLTAVLVVWAVAFRAGETSEKRRWTGIVDPGEPALAEPQPSTADPLNPVPLAPGAGPGPGGDSAGSRRSEARPLVPEADPRLPGHYYLVLQSQLTLEKARATAEFLSAQGLPAVVLPNRSGVDPKQLMTKNGRDWRVLVAEGISDAEYRRNAARKTELEVQVKQHGLRWARDPKGGFNFNDSFWQTRGS